MGAILTQISEIFFMLLKLFSAYFSGIALFGLLPGKPAERREPEQRLKFAVLLPARNEESCIAAAVESILHQDYPPELADVYVIPNNCQDDTAGAALRAGARVLNVSSQVHSKGAALREAAEQLLGSAEGYEAFCVFDADNEADEHFLSAMNRCLCTQARIAKSRIFSKNAEQSWVCACYEIYFCLANVFLNRARARLGLSARVIGTGFAIRRDLLTELGGFPAETITEDAELWTLCAIQGEKIAFCPEAVTYDEEPLSFRTSLVQRRRWMSGIMQVCGLRLRELLAMILHRKSSWKMAAISAADVCIQLCFGYMQALLPGFLLLSWLAEPGAALAALPLSLATGWAVASGQALLVLLLQKRWRGYMWRGVLLYPLFIFSFVPLQSLALLRRTTVWREIPHTGVRQFSPEQERRQLRQYV